MTLRETGYSDLYVGYLAPYGLARLFSITNADLVNMLEHYLEDIEDELERHGHTF